jgi:hypothetical protein
MDCEYYADLTPWRTSTQRYYISAESRKKVNEEDVVPEAQDAATAEGAAAAAVEGAAEGGAEAPAGDAATTPPAETPADPNAVSPADPNVVPPADPNAVPPVDPATGATAEPMLDENGQPIAGAGGDDLTKGGWVIQLVGHHFHNNMPFQNVTVGDEATQFVINTLCNKLETGEVELPDGEGGKPIKVKISDLGIKFPTIVWRQKVQTVNYRSESEEAFRMRTEALTKPTTTGAPATTANPEDLEPKKFTLRRYDFILQFVWQPQPRSARLEKAKQGTEQPAEQPAEAGPGTAAVGEEPAASGDST